MTPRVRTVVSAAAERVESFFLEPAEPAPPAEPPADRRALSLVPPVGADPSVEDGPDPSASGRPAGAEPVAAPAVPALRPVVAVFGLRRRCGATVVARGLAAELAGRDEAGAAAVASTSLTSSLPLASAAAGRLAERLADVPGARTTAVGRLCLVTGAGPAALADTARHFAPLVIDAGGGSLDGGDAETADHVVLVAGPGVEAALTRVAAGCIRAAGVEPLVVTNRGPLDTDGEWLELPDSRMGAQLALGGRTGRGELGRAIAVIADLCEAAT